MDIILNKIPDNYENNDTLWIYKDNIPIFNQYNQINQIKNEENIMNNNNINEENIKKDNKINEEIIKKDNKINEIIKNKIDENKGIIRRENNRGRKEINQYTPINLIINQTFTANVMKNEVKQRLIDFVSEPEFTKAFGAKKAGEIMNALIRDSWNQSIALFISFLLDANLIYKEKSYIYNKEKNKQEISIMVK